MVALGYVQLLYAFIEVKIRDASVEEMFTS
jgi:hypothetical protein